MCQLKPLDPADYAMTFTAAQWTSLQQAFPDGVCDWSQPAAAGNRRRPAGPNAATYPPPSMRLLIVRHAEAALGSPDELRSLTPEGRGHALALGLRLRDEGFAPDAVVASPLLRARETAEALGFGEPEIDERLAPGATPFEVRDAAAGRGETVVVVGHQPDCSKAVAALSGGLEPAFPPCAHALVELE